MTKIKAFLHILGIYALAMTILTAILFWPDKGTTFFVHPCKQEYCVYMEVIGQDNIQVSKPMPLDDATDLVNRLNDTMANQWAATK